jgi:DNA-3-methyladenine glycosylase I
MFPFPVGEVPADDRAYFEMLSWFVFGAGLNWRVMKAKWPHFIEAFDRFDIDKVAAYGEPDIDRLLADTGIVRNGKKVVGTVENARELQRIERDDDGMTKWLRSFGADTDELQRAVKKRFHHIGETTARMFLTCTGAVEYGTWEPTDRQRKG